MPGVWTGMLAELSGAERGNFRRGNSALYGMRPAERIRKMDRTKFIQDSTKVYLIAYDYALKEVRNPSMANNIASVITMSYMTTFKTEIETEQQAQTLFGMMVSIARAAKAEREDDDEE